MILILPGGFVLPLCFMGSPSLLEVSVSPHKVSNVYSQKISKSTELKNLSLKKLFFLLDLTGQGPECLDLWICQIILGTQAYLIGRQLGHRLQDNNLF